MLRTHAFQVGDRVMYLWDARQKEIEPAAYVGEVTNVYDTTNDVVVRFDNGEWEQVDADDYKALPPLSHAKPSA